jgi:hypothetical protein
MWSRDKKNNPSVELSVDDDARDDADGIPLWPSTTVCERG